MSGGSVCIGGGGAAVTGDRAGRIKLDEDSAVSQQTYWVPAVYLVPGMLPLREENRHLPLVPVRALVSSHLLPHLSPASQVVLSPPCLLHLPILPHAHILCPTAAASPWTMVSPLTPSPPGSFRGGDGHPKTLTGFPIASKAKSKLLRRTRRPLISGSCSALPSSEGSLLPP